MKKICQQQKVDVSVNKCGDGDFYSTYPTGFVVDAATEIYDKNAEHIDSCGGNRFYSSDQAREEAERKCAALSRQVHASGRVLSLPSLKASLSNL